MSQLLVDLCARAPLKIGVGGGGISLHFILCGRAHDTLRGGTSTFREFSKRQNESSRTSVTLRRFENSRNVEMSTWLAVRPVYSGSGIPSWRQILRANRSAISVWRGTV